MATANPEDYTNRGRIVTPLKDRYGAQVRTHYPTDVEQEIAIVEQEYTRFPEASERVAVPHYMKEVIAEITRMARRSPEIDQRPGVSLRVSISNYETMLGSAFKAEHPSRRAGLSPGERPARDHGLDYGQDRDGERGRVS